jgi:hypothetical protein
MKKVGIIIWSAHQRARKGGVAEAHRHNPSGRMAFPRGRASAPRPKPGEGSASPHLAGEPIILELQWPCKKKLPAHDSGP